MTTINVTEVLEKIKESIGFVETRTGPFLIYTNDFIVSYSIAIYGEYSQAEIEVMSRFLDKDSTYLDIGTNIGYHLLSIQDKTNCAAIGFEPHPTHFAMAAYNCRERPIKLFQAAVGDGKSPTLKLTDFDVTVDGNYGETAIENSGELTVPIITIDELNLDNCTLMKIDTEGQELAVIKGAENTINKFRPVIFYEALKDGDYTKVYKYLKKKGYEQYWVCVRVHPFLHKPFREPEDNPFGETGITNIIAIPKENEQPTDLLPVVENEFHEQTFQRLKNYKLVF